VPKIPERTATKTPRHKEAVYFNMENSRRWGAGTIGSAVKPHVEYWNAGIMGLGEWELFQW
jgi:hypothetical protein